MTQNFHTDLDQDLNIYYSGGSGGFLFLYLLLLSDSTYQVIVDCSYDWYCKWVQQNRSKEWFQNWVHQNIHLPHGELPNDLNIEQRKEYILNTVTCEDNYLKIYQNFYKSHIQKELMDFMIHRQWSSTKSKWQDNECWPLNHLTQQLANIHNKIYFTCNDVKQWKSLPGHKIIIWTDIRSQIRLAWFKKANWFVKDTKKSLMQHRKLISQLLKDPVHQTVTEAREQGTGIKLQDIANSRHWNDQQLEFLQNWRQQHPEILLKKIGIEI